MDVLIEDETLPYYAKLFSAIPNEFELLVDIDVLISSDETIITESYAKEHNLNIGDTINFYITDKSFEYSIGEIIEDKGLFTGNVFYLDKETLLEEVYGLGTLSNLGNTIYLNLFDNVDIDQFAVTLKSDDFSAYNVFPTIDFDSIRNKAMDLTSMLLALSIIILVAVVMVLDSLFPIVNREVRQNLGITKTLGAKSNFIKQVNLIQWAIYTLISFILGIILALFIINYGLKVYGITGFVPIRFENILFSLIAVGAFIFIRAMIGFNRELKLSIADQSRNKKFIKYETKYIYIIVALLALLIEIIFKFFNQKVHSLIIVVLSIYLALNIASILLVFLSKIFQKGKRQSIFKIFQLKYLKINKHIHQSLRVIIISLLALVLIFSVRIFMSDQIDEFYNAMDFDMALVNIYDYDDSLLNQVDTYDVTTNDPAIFYRNVILDFNDTDSEPIIFFVSMSQDSVNDYFNLDFGDVDIQEQYVSDDTPYIILPVNFKYIYNLNIGDVLTMDLNYNLLNVQVFVAGFVETNLDNIVYSNIIEVESYQETAKPNSIFINSDNEEELFKDLVRDFSPRLYYVLNPDIYFSNMVSSVESLTDYFSILTFFMIICFVIIIFNNTILVFYGLKNDLAKILVLGADGKEFLLNLFKEFLMIFSVIVVIGIGETLILSEHLKWVVLFTNFYKDISSTPLTIIYSCAIVNLVLLLSYLYYFYD